MLVLEADRAQRLRFPPAVKECGGSVDHWPAQPGEEPQRSREIRQQQRGLLFPRENGLHSELGKRLQPGQYGKRKSLSDEELSRLCRPGDEHGRRKNGWSSPQDGPWPDFPD